MVVIKLYGILEDVAQRTLKVKVESFGEAIDAMLANFPKLRRALKDINVSVLVDGKMVRFEDFLRPMNAERIDIMPVIGGAGPAVLIIAGAAMVAGEAIIAGALAGMVGTALATTIAASIAQFGIALIIGGISQILFKPPKQDLAGAGAAQRADEAPSYLFNGAVNVSTQGGVVPVGFGRMKVGSQVISANIQTWDIPIPVVVTPPPPPTPVAAPEEWTSRSVEIA